MTLVDIGPFYEKSVPAPLQVTFTDSAGTAIDVTGLTIKFVYWLVNATSGTEATGVIVTAASGIVKYVWTTTDTTTPGSYQGRMHAYNGTTTRYESDTYCWIVVDDPAIPAAY